MNVSATVRNFSQALAAIAPAFDKAGLPWSRPDAYDEWDDVATALFTALVTEVLRWQLPERLRETFTIAPYDLLLESYRDVGTIDIVNIEAAPGSRCVFHALATDQIPFDTVEFRRVSIAGTPVGDGLERAPLGTASLQLRVSDPQTAKVLMLE